MKILNRLSKKSAIRIGIFLLVISLLFPVLTYWGMIASFNNSKYDYFQWILKYQSVITGVLGVSTLMWLCWVIPAVSLRHMQRTGQSCSEDVRFRYYLYIWFPIVVPVYIVMTKVGLGNGDDWIYLSAALCFVVINMIVFMRFRYRLNHPVAMDTCPECGYSLRGLESQRCPECGEVIQLCKERKG